MEKDPSNLKAIIGAILALETVVVVQLASVSVLSNSLLLTVFAFAASIPLLSIAIGLMMHFDRKETPEDERGGIYMGSMVLGCFLGLFGLIALFWHLNPAAGFLFGYLGFAGLYLATRDFE